MISLAHELFMSEHYPVTLMSGFVTCLMGLYDALFFMLTSAGGVVSEQETG